MRIRKEGELDRWMGPARPKLVRIAAAVLRDAAEAENVVQETLTAVWQAHGRGEVDHLDAYAQRGVWLNALRHRARRRDWHPLESVAEAELAVPAELHDLGAWELEHAVLGLPAVQQLAIRLRFYGGLSFKEIGEALSISMNTAASRCRYGLSALRASLGAVYPKEEEDHEPEV